METTLLKDLRKTYSELMELNTPKLYLHNVANEHNIKWWKNTYLDYDRRNSSYITNHKQALPQYWYFRRTSPMQLQQQSKKLSYFILLSPIVYQNLISPELQRYFVSEFTQSPISKLKMSYFLPLKFSFFKSKRLSTVQWCHHAVKCLAIS